MKAFRAGKKNVTDQSFEPKAAFPELYTWMQGIPFQQYQYVTFASQRISNLTEIAQKKHVANLPDYITESGLLLQAENIANVYNRKRCFPKIAIVDDALVYGRHMNLFLSKLWRTIRQCLNRLNAALDADEAENTFIQNIDLWIYAISESPILLRHEFQWNIHSCLMLRKSEMGSLANSFSSAIAEENVANTSYVISASLPQKMDRYQPSSKSWVSSKNLQYRNNTQSYEFFLFTNAVKYGVYPSVRSYKKGSCIYYTPHFFMPELTWTQLVEFLEAVLGISAQQDLETTKECIYLLNRAKGCTARLAVYAQFAILLLSQITLSVFFKGFVAREWLFYDTEKISRSFGLQKDIEPILCRFCKIQWSESQFCELLEHLDIPQNDGTPQNKVDCAEVMNSVELLAYKQAVDHERDAVERTRHDPEAIPADLSVNQIGEQKLERFLSRVEENAHVGTDIKSMLPVLSCLTQMMDLGDITLKVRSRWIDRMPVFYFSLRTTEMSLAIMPRKLGGYYRQFSVLARLYWRDEDFPDRVERYFRDAVFSGDPEGRNEVVISNARYFAQIISENRMVMNSMLNWDARGEDSTRD